MYLVVLILLAILPPSAILAIIGLAAMANTRKKKRGVKALTRSYNLRNSNGPIAKLYRRTHKDWNMH